MKDTDKRMGIDGNLKSRRFGWRQILSVVSSLVDVFLLVWLLLSISVYNSRDLGNDLVEYENPKFKTHQRFRPYII